MTRRLGRPDTNRSTPSPALCQRQGGRNHDLYRAGELRVLQSHEGLRLEAGVLLRDHGGRDSDRVQLDRHQSDQAAACGIRTRSSMMSSDDQKLFQGVIKSWDQPRGFGFAKRTDGQGDIFVHLSNLSDRGDLAVGTEIAFGIDRDPKTGRRMAADVRIIRSSLPRVRGRPEPSGTGFSVTSVTGT